MIKHFVEFYSPGTFFSETTSKPIDSWDINTALEMVKGIKERYNATPYGFKFVTYERSDSDLDSKVSKKSNMYFLGGTIETLAQIEARHDDDDRILISNMHNNGYDKVLVNTNSWKIVVPIEKGDIILQWQPIET